MPAAAVIPAPVAYIKAVAVKKLVVGYQCVSGPACPARYGGNAMTPGLPNVGWPHSIVSDSSAAVLRRGLLATGGVTLNKLECSKQALNACIHIHGIGEYVPGSILVGFESRREMINRD